MYCLHCVESCELSVRRIVRCFSMQVARNSDARRTIDHDGSRWVCFLFCYRLGRSPTGRSRLEPILCFSCAFQPNRVSFPGFPASEDRKSPLTEGLSVQARWRRPSSTHSVPPISSSCFRELVDDLFFGAPAQKSQLHLQFMFCFLVDG